jgi:hypothetical protein
MAPIVPIRAAAAILVIWLSSPQPARAASGLEAELEPLRGLCARLQHTTLGLLAAVKQLEALAP